MNATTNGAQRLRESNPVAEDAFANAASDSLGRTTFEHIISSPTGPLPVRGRAPGRRQLLAIGAGAAVVAGLLAVLLPGSPRLTSPVHTAWQAARPLPRGAAVAGPAAAGTWRLVGYLVSGGWQRHTAGPEPGLLTCPTPMTCYVQGINAPSASGPPDLNSFYVSTDDAMSWSVLPLPSGITFTSALSCNSVASCAAGALDRGRPVLVITADGGHSWTIDPLPAGDGQIFQLSCPTATTCGALAAASASLPPGQQYYSGVKFLATTDGGGNFAASAFPAGESMQYVSCPTTSHCVAIGVHNHSNDMTKGVVATSADGGARWKPGVLPPGMGLGPFPQVGCVDAGHCTMLAFAGNRSSVAVSADGGRTWAERPVPASVPGPFLSQIACPTDTTCYAAGEENVPQHFANSFSASSAMVLITHDGGLSWTRVTFPAPSRLPRGVHSDAFMTIGSIQCPQVNACVGLGVSEQGSKSTPVYTGKTTP